MARVTLKLLRRLVALTLALALFAPASAFGRLLYACGMSGKLSAGSCCCQRAKLDESRAEQAAGVAPHAKLERASCCKAEDHRRDAVAGSLSASELLVLAAAPNGFVPAVPQQELLSERLALRARTSRGPPAGPAVYTANCSLLI